jgi:CRP/FNR family transcriptional regulator
MPVGLKRDELDRLTSLISVRKRVKKGQALIRSGEAFASLYAVRTGFFKTVVNSGHGHEQITGFQMAADVIGLEGIHTNRHGCSVIALEDAEVCVVPFAQLEELAHELPNFQHQINRLMSREIVREHNALLQLGSMQADARVAAFLLDLAQRLHSRGYSAHELVLRMSREEIGSYLGLKLETVSRVFSKFAEEGLLSVKLKEVQILKLEALEAIMHTHH